MVYWMIPMSYAPRPKEDCIVKVLISRRTIATSLSGVENERNINICFLLSLLKSYQWFQVIV